MVGGRWGKASTSSSCSPPTSSCQTSDFCLFAPPEAPGHWSLFSHPLLRQHHSPIVVLAGGFQKSAALADQENRHDIRFFFAWHGAAIRVKGSTRRMSARASWCRGRHIADQSPQSRVRQRCREKSVALLPLAPWLRVLPTTGVRAFHHGEQSAALGRSQKQILLP